MLLCMKKYDDEEEERYCGVDGRHRANCDGKKDIPRLSANALLKHDRTIPHDTIHTYETLYTAGAISVCIIIPFDKIRSESPSFAHVRIIPPGLAP